MSYLIIFFLLVLLICVMTTLSFFKNKDIIQKSDSFECGFNSLNNPSLPFNMPFFYVTLMFLIFDLELALLIFFPLLNKENESLSNYTFLTLLIIFFLTIYEWEKDLINWF